MGYSMSFLSMTESYIESPQNNSNPVSPTGATIRTSRIVNKLGLVVKSDHLFDPYIL